MVTGNDAADQIVRYTLEGTEIILKLTGVAAKNAAMFLTSVLKDQKKTRGKTTVTRMLREGKELKFFPVPTNQLQQFAKEAKRYGLLFVAMRHKGCKEAETDVMVFAQDAAKVNRIMDRLELANINPEAVGVELMNERGQDTPVNFTERARNSPFGSSSRSNSGLMPKPPEGAGAERLALPAPAHTVIITPEPKELLALPERTDGVIIQPPGPRRETPRTLALRGVVANGILALPAPEEEFHSVRDDLKAIREQQEKARLQNGEQLRQKNPRKQVKKTKSKAKAR